MKRSIVFLLAISLILCLLSCQEDKNPDKTVDTAAKTTEPSASTTTTSPYGDESLIPTDESLFEYEARNVGTVAIKKYIGEEADVVIPAEIGGKKVIEIGSQAFTGGKISSIVLPNCVETILGGAFMDCSALKKATFNEGLKNIGPSAFENCTGLGEISLPSSIETIEGGAFMNCSALRKAVLNEGLKEIGSSAFEGCESLSDVNLPDSLENLYFYAFVGCKALKSINIPTDCLGNGSTSLFISSGLESITLNEGITFIPGNFISYTNVTEVILPSTVKTIDAYAFSMCHKLKSITLNEGLECIGYRAFIGQNNLTEIVIPKTVKVVQDTAFDSSAPDGETRDQTIKVKFEGNAPEQFIDNGTTIEKNVHITICYHDGAKGFTYPEWNGYPTEIW